MAGTGSCRQCSAVLAAPLDHAPFCRPECRATWNRERMGEAGALAWSVAAMSEATGRLALVRTGDVPQALAAVEEAVWWITMVDATLMRHHLDVYEGVLGASGAAERFRTGQTLAGLSFVRDRIGADTDLSEVVDTSLSRAADRRITNWRWMRIPAPPVGPAKHQQDQAAAGYRAYQGQLAGRMIGEAIGLAVTFLTFTGASAASAIDLSERATRKPASGPRT